MFLRVLGISLLALLTSCASGGPSSMPPDASSRPASDAPPRFDPPDGAGRLAPVDTLAGGGCLNPMRDPEDGARLTLIRSGGQRGDYAVPQGRYGVREGELLRLDCNTGAPIGIVAR